MVCGGKARGTMFSGIRINLMSETFQLHVCLV